MKFVDCGYKKGLKKYNEHGQYIGNFKNKDGTPDRYAFKCGHYVEFKRKDGYKIQLYLDGCWQIKILKPCGFLHVWTNAETLTEAKNKIKKLKEIDVSLLTKIGIELKFNGESFKL